jgi:hypothetical protein
MDFYFFIAGNEILKIDNGGVLGKEYCYDFGSMELKVL